MKRFQFRLSVLWKFLTESNVKSCRNYELGPIRPWFFHVTRNESSSSLDSHDGRLSNQNMFSIRHICPVFLYLICFLYIAKGVRTNFLKNWRCVGFVLIWGVGPTLLVVIYIKGVIQSETGIFDTSWIILRRGESRKITHYHYILKETWTWNQRLYLNYMSETYTSFSGMKF